MKLSNENREVRRRPTAVVQCPRCGKQVTLIAETEEWVESRGGIWKHSGYGPGCGDCCGLAFLDSPWDGIMTFQIETAADSTVSEHSEIRRENE